MVEIKASYLGQKRCLTTHTQSGCSFNTDAPKDNQGLGESFSPTDLLATGLATCALTTVALHAEKENIDLTGSRAIVEKVMAQNPRRIASLNMTIFFPNSISDSFKNKILQIIETCPAKLSLHPDIKSNCDIAFF